MRLLLKALLLTLFAACSSAPDGPRGYLTNESFTDSGDWGVNGDPESYAAAQYLIVTVEDEDGNLSQDLGGWLEAELGRVKRFKTYIQYNNGAIRLASDLARLGVVDSPIQVLPELGLALQVGLSPKRETKEDPTGNNREHFTVDLKYLLADLNRMSDPLAAQTLVGTSTRLVAVGTKGQRVGGWIDDSAGIAAAFQEATIGPLRDLVTRLGNEYPVVADVVSITGTRIAINKGSNNGLSGKGNFTLCLYANGMDIPIMKAISESTLHERSTLEIVKFNTSNADASPYIKSFKDDPLSWLDQHGSNTYVVSVGLGLPKEWANVKSQKSGRIQ